MKTLIVGITLMSLAGLAGALPGATVRMTSRHAFVPKTLTIKVGDTVVWENDSPGVHTVTDNSAFALTKQDASTPAGTEPFNSGPVEAGQQYSHTFTAAGTYKYFCVPHEADGMVGTIIVTK